MLTTKRCGPDLARSTKEELTTSEIGGEMIDYYLTNSNKRQKICKSGGETVDSLPSGSDVTFGMGPGMSSGSDGDSRECLSLEVMSKLVKSAVSLFLFDRGIIVFACSGIPVERKSSYIRLFSSSNLATALRDKRKPGSSMTIQVRDVSNNVACGWLEQYDEEYGTAFVSVTQFLDVCVVNLHHGLEFHSNLVAIQLVDSEATPVRGIPVKDSSTSEGGKVICEISKGGDGGPLFDDGGNFVGMNFFSDTGKWGFVHKSVIIEQFEKRKKLRMQRELNRFRPVVIHRYGRHRLEENYVLI